jgi:hypothetical protein
MHHTLVKLHSSLSLKQAAGLEQQPLLLLLLLLLLQCHLGLLLLLLQCQLGLLHPHKPWCKQTARPSASH